MPNCADCGQNGRLGHKKDCPVDKSVSRWARYRRRLKAKKQEKGQEVTA